ncbi:hypothetical protein [Robbsia sp. KACC 23696]|uniref:hypothetical protein n=1 Tax=Robbsia sp. KACC 23696 TaxID=3149231 RepID=UPI00325A5427
MKEHPILFSRAMVRAILDGRKTQTRRVIKAASVADASTNGARASCCPYATGQRLWVRETWAQPVLLDPGPTFYRADYPACVPAHYENVPPAEAITWKPSIHMPRALSRITLEVTDVRAEQLQQCTNGNAWAEGCPEEENWPLDWYRALWDSLNADRGHGWDANPWVWVVAFRRVTP